MNDTPGGIADTSTTGPVIKTSPIDPFNATSPGALMGKQPQECGGVPSALYAPVITFSSSAVAAAGGEELESEVEDVGGVFLPTDVLFLRLDAGAPKEWIGFYINKSSAELRVNKLPQPVDILDIGDVDNRVGYSLRWLAELAGIQLHKIDQLSIRVTAAAANDQVTALVYRGPYAQMLLARHT
jgi:hypothetical protein